MCKSDHGHANCLQFWCQKLFYPGWRAQWGQYIYKFWFDWPSLFQKIRLIVWCFYIICFLIQLKQGLELPLSLFCFIALLKRATGAICSWFSLVKQQRRIAPVALKIKSKRAKSKRAKSEKVKSERAKERILNPALKSNFCLTVSNECWTFLTFYFLVAAGKPFAYMGGPLLFTQTNWSCQAGIMIGLQSIRPRKTVLEKVIGSAKKT